MLEGAVVTAMKIHENRHDFTQPQGRQPQTVAMAGLEQALGIDRGKSLAEIINIAAHRNALQLVHRNPLLVTLMRG
jgi:hypothetical protein